VDITGTTTRENRSIVTWTDIVIQPRSKHNVPRNLSYQMQISILHNRHVGEKLNDQYDAPFRISLICSRGTLCPWNMDLLANKPPVSDMRSSVVTKEEQFSDRTYI
jgi:hypothetical protein